ncbi:DUF5954 family protein [Salinispora arenicola]|uniref:DUF5954 family protein n=1 Tax=Salinispora arenicola TaxID=168697 RepID=UPI000382ECD7|nr:DUF5954 family protein [Salinispora arenicola]NIL59228.1 hypothetical protein [Salinispora arenicola]NIL60987.1 hypothetical protein [Salinispora arenicola]
MAYPEDQVPDHLLIKVEQRDDPVSVVSEDDARQRSAMYPKLMWGAPIFGAAEQDGGWWRILQLNDDEPQHARDNLASHFRKLHSELPDTAEHVSARAEYETAYELLDWEPADELTVAGRRYRIIRAQPFIRMGADGPEPPRPTDAELFPPGTSTLGRPQMDGFVLDPTVSTGLTDGLVRMELTSSFVSLDAGEQVRAESRRAVTTHPNVVLLPVSYTISGYVAGTWGQRGPATYATPQAARDGGSFSMRDFVLDENTAPEEFMAAYERARAAHQPPRTDDFEADGVPCRVTRVEAFIRVGPDGPEGPRPSDRDSYPPPARQVHDLRAKGLMPDPD